MDWSGVDYCDVFISCLDSHSDGTHSLQRIHWWASDGMLHFSKSDEETNSSASWMAWRWVCFHVWVNYSFKVCWILWTAHITCASMRRWSFERGWCSIGWPNRGKGPSSTAGWGRCVFEDAQTKWSFIEQDMTSVCLFCRQEVQIDKKLQAGLRVTVQLNDSQNKGTDTHSAYSIIIIIYIFFLL